MAHILIVSANFYRDIAGALSTGAQEYLHYSGHSFETIEVPGAYEVPAAIRFAMQMKEPRYDGFVALGCVIRGETTHYDYVCGESARGLQELAIHHNAAIGNGILTTENQEQAWARAAIDKGNKGRAAAEACVRMVELKEQFGLVSA